ncbi:MAG: tetratricopeptide repeat protein [Proteobacteria bacterium]|nr:tetratricopeptide repeat protein [Pseudomonadota bacterium]MDE2411217.1 tetratricopeptide repeat protein [Sphingomonadales bacterium]
MAAQQDGFLREVDEALREDQMVGAFKRYGKPVGLGILAGLVALGGYLYWDHSQKQAAGERSERMILAMEKAGSGPASAAASLAEFDALAKDGSDGSKAAAALTAAGIRQQEGKTDEAAKAFAAIAADGGAPQPYRDLATLREVSLRFDTMQPQQVIDRLKPLAVPGNAWFGSAGELVGLAYLKQGKPDLAGPLFGAVAKDKTVPESLRARARLLASQLGVDGGDTPDAASAATAQPAQ